MNGIATLAMVNLDCADPPALAAFYHEVLGWPLRHSDENYAMIGDGTMNIGFGRVDGHRPPRWPDEDSAKRYHLDLYVQDLDKAEQRCRELGAVTPKFQPGGERWRVMLDPAGHPFCLCPAPRAPGRAARSRTAPRRRRRRTARPGGRDVSAGRRVDRRVSLELVLLGVGAMNSPRFRPAGLLLLSAGLRIMFDGGGTCVPGVPPAAWLVCDEHAELMPDLRRRCRDLGIRPGAAPFGGPGVRVEPLPVAHTSHPAFGYLITAGARRVVWAPEFWRFPAWAHDADLMFADAAGWRRPIRFAGGVGGHAAVHDTAEQARRRGVRRLVFAHIGRPSIRAIDAGERPPYGEWGVENARYRP